MDGQFFQVIEALEARSQAEEVQLAVLRKGPVGAVKDNAAGLMLDVGREAGQVLHAIARLGRARRILEIGGGVGYSTLWLAEAARANGGLVFSFEPDAGKHEEAKANLEKAGLSKHVRLFCEDASAALPRLEGPFDLVLIDHWKGLYVREFRTVWPKVSPTGVVIADNILFPETMKQHITAYLEEVRKVPGAVSFTLSVGHGLELTYRVA